MQATLQRIIVFVASVETCGDWYCEHFGFQKVEATFQERMWYEVRTGDGVSVAFHQAFDENGPVTEPTGGPGDPYKLVFAVDDLAGFRRRLVEGGVQMFEPFGDGQACDGLDCENHRFQLVQRPGV